MTRTDMITTTKIVREDHKRMFFNAWSVRRMQANAKFNTRRIITDYEGGITDAEGAFQNEQGDFTFYFGALDDKGDICGYAAPKYKQGETYLVAEPLVQSHYEDCIQYEADERFVLRDEPMGCLAESVGADPYTMASSKIEWPYKPERLPSIFCPKWACRYAVRIEDVRVERVADISPEDAVAEGLYERADGHYEASGKHAYSEDPVKAFEALWDEMHGDGAWERNDWVFVYELSELIEID